METKKTAMRDLLYDLYITQKLNTREISEIIEKPQRTVNRWLHNYGIPVRDRGGLKYPQLRNREWLYNEYVTKHKSSTKIAEEIDAKPRAVVHWLERHSIPRRAAGGQLKGKKMSAESRRKMSLARKGKYRGANHWRWKGGEISPDIRERQSTVARKWRQTILERDGFKCAHCGSTERLHVHHIIPFKENKERRWDLTNGVTLCAICHEKVHGFRFPDWVSGREPHLKAGDTPEYITVKKQEKFEPPREELEELYNEWTTAQIAEFYGVNAETVRKRLHEYVIPVRKAYARRTFMPPKKELSELYQKFSMKQIADIYGIGETVIWKRIQEYGISLNGVGNGGHRKEKGKEFSESHKKALSKSHMGRHTGPENPNWRGGPITIICNNCGNPFQIPRAREKTAKFCSRECKHKWQSKSLTKR